MPCYINLCCPSLQCEHLCARFIYLGTDIKDIFDLISVEADDQF